MLCCPAHRQLFGSVADQALCRQAVNELVTALTFLPDFWAALLQTASGGMQDAARRRGLALKMPRDQYVCRLYMLAAACLLACLSLAALRAAEGPKQPQHRQAKHMLRQLCQDLNSMQIQTRTWK